MKEKNNFIWWRLFKRIIFALSSFVVLFIGLSILVINIYEDEIKHFAIKNINNNLTAEINVKSIDLTLVEQFPMASLRFSNVFIHDKLKGKKDTLIYSEYVYLNLNFLDLINGKYQIKNITAKNTIAYLSVNNKGKENYIIWKQDSVNNEEKFKFDLKQVRFKNLSLKYNNDIQKQNFYITTEKIKFKGKFSNENYNLETKGDVFVNKFNHNGVNYITNKNAKLDVNLLVNNLNNSYKIKKGNISIEDLDFDVLGEYISHKNKSPFINLIIKGYNISFLSLFSIFPNNIFYELQKFKARGILTFESTISGSVDKNNTPSIEATFNMEGGNITERETELSLQNICFNGSFNNDYKGKTRLVLNNIKGDFSNNGGSFNGDVSIIDLSNPIIESNLKSKLDLEIANNFIPKKNIKNLSGNADINYKIKLRRLNNKFIIDKSIGKIIFNNVNISKHLDSAFYKNITGVGIIENNKISFNNVKFLAGDSKVNCNILFNNLIPHILNNKQNIWVDAYISSKKINLSDFVSSLNTNSNNNNIDTLSIPKQFNVSLTTNINELIYDNFKAKNVVGNIQLKQKNININNFNFTTSDGNVVLNSKIEQLSNNNFLCFGNSKLEGVDINKLFSSLNNFGQSYITNEHLKGKGNLILGFRVSFLNNLKVIPSSIIVDAKTKISKGVLINHPTMNELANYLDKNKLVNKIVDTKEIKKKISKIKFSELNSHIRIKDEKILIPKTSIKTNVIDINIAGEHSFDNNIDYHLNFGLRDILIKNKKQEDFGPIKDDGLGKVIFMHIFGKTDNLSYKIDKSEKKLNKKHTREEEKDNVKSILKDEFGLFKKDSTIKQNTNNNTTEPTFEVEKWEETNNSIEQNINNKTNNNKKKKSTPKWLKKLGVDNNKKDDISIEIEN